MLRDKACLLPSLCPLFHYCSLGFLAKIVDTYLFLHFLLSLRSYMKISREIKIGIDHKPPE